jgi:predicted amidohydrolase
MMVDLFCVQPVMTPEDYFTKEAFYHKIDRYFRAAAKTRTPGRPAVIVFPEDIATFLLLEGQQDIVAGVRTLDDAFKTIGRKKLGRIVLTMIQYGTVRTRRAFFTGGATGVWHIWHGTMARLAHDYEMTVVAGSALIPESRWIYDSNRYLPRNPNVYNFSFTVGPTGHVIHTTRKVNLVPTQEDVLELTPGPAEQAAQPTTLPGTDIRMGTVICYDGFVRPHTAQEPKFVNILKLLDDNGAQLAAQPSANPWRWDEPWPLDTAAVPRIRRQQWDEEGSQAALAACRNIQVVVNPQLVFEFLDMHFDGESRILARTPDGVQVLVNSQGIRGNEADAVLHSAWDFAPSTESTI